MKAADGRQHHRLRKDGQESLTAESNEGEVVPAPDGKCVVCRPVGVVPRPPPTTRVGRGRPVRSSVRSCGAPRAGRARGTVL